MIVTVSSLSPEYNGLSKFACRQCMGLHSLVEEYCSVNVDAKSSIWLKPRNFRVYQLLKLYFNYVEYIFISIYANSVTQNYNKGHLYETSD